MSFSTSACVQKELAVKEDKLRMAWAAALAQLKSLLLLEQVLDIRGLRLYVQN